MTIDWTSNFRMLIDGELVAGEATIDVVNPATAQSFAQAPDASEADLDRAVAAAARAFPGWRDTPIAERRAAIEAAAKLLFQNAEAIAPLFTKEQGRSLEASKMETMGMSAWFKATARRDLPVEVVHEDARTRCEVHRVPLGVVGAIVPWNSPLLLLGWKLAPALLAGNTIVVKPSPFTPLCTLKLGELIGRLFPPGVVNILSGGDALGPLMTRHPDIAKISFTGSTATGKRVMEGAAGTLKKVTLELGGNDPAIVFADADLDKVAPALFMSAFINTAQVCVATKRLYIHDSIYDDLLGRLHAIARATKVGDGLEPGTVLGPLQNAAQKARSESLIASARDAGYGVLQGEAPAGDGFFVPVTLVDNPADDARVVIEEAFGPVLPLLRFTGTDEVIARANATDYGLGATIWTSDIAAAQKIAQRIEAGSVWINSPGMPTPYAPFTGHKQSGIGSENGQDGLLEFTQPKSIHIPMG
jgi:acyl-CoA reductase-like NAD-dependent aldehyde dehydrogenase